MPDIPGTSRAQTIFLRAFAKNPSGPPPQAWPSPSILRRWLRRPRFRAALRSIEETLKFRSDFLLTATASTAFQSIDAGNPSHDQLRDLYSFLRLSHLRQRFTSSVLPEANFKKEESHNEWLKKLNPANRLTQEEFHALALQRRYVPDLRKIDQFPEPVPQDTFYYKLLQDPSALLWWMKLYEHKTADQRYRKILEHCKDFVPYNTPWSGDFPFFPNMPHLDPCDPDAKPNRGPIP